MSAKHDWSRCHLCGSAEVEADSPPGSPTCAECRPIREHVVSMQTATGGGSLAVCRCGWRSDVAGAARYIVQDAKVRMHWRDVIRRKLAEIESELGDGSALADMKAGAIVGLGLFWSSVGGLLLVDAVLGAGA